MRLVVVGDIFNTKFSGKCKVVEYFGSKRVTVEFEDGHKVTTSSANIRSGSVGNKNRSRIFNVAINDVENMTDSRFYKIWHSMIRRCYSSYYQKSKPNYVGVKVCDRWLRFSNFLEDVSKIPYSDVDDYQLDKDIVGNGLLYSLETVCFVPREINQALIKSNKSEKLKGCYRIENRFIPSIRSGGMVDISKELMVKASYPTQEEAFKVYKSVKREFLKRLACKYKGFISKEVFDTLYKYDDF